MTREELLALPLRDWRTIRAALRRASDWSDPIDPADGNARWRQRERAFIERCRVIEAKIGQAILAVQEKERGE